jgi:V8-like Glu-specific endopeptidase
VTLHHQPVDGARSVERERVSCFRQPRMLVGPVSSRSFIVLLLSLLLLLKCLLHATSSPHPPRELRSNSRNSSLIIREASITLPIPADVANEEVTNPIAEGKIVGGRVVGDSSSFPWIVSVQVRWDGRFNHICGGTLIDKNYVLTAAHCVRPDVIGTDGTLFVDVGRLTLDQTK